jgi:hypothetical protein
MMKAAYVQAYRFGFATGFRQQRRIQRVIADPDYDPKVFTDCAPARLKKSMESRGSVALNPTP